MMYIPDLRGIGLSVFCLVVTEASGEELGRASGSVSEALQLQCCGQTNKKKKINNDDNNNSIILIQ